MWLLSKSLNFNAADVVTRREDNENSITEMFFPEARIPSINLRGTEMGFVRIKKQARSRATIAPKL